MQRINHVAWCVICLVFSMHAARIDAQQITPSAPPAFWSWAVTPPLGWNSYDAFGDTVTEEEVLANAQYMKDHLLTHGWNYVVIDFRWYDPEPTGDDLTLNQKRTGAKLAADAFGRMMPAENRFPSTADGKGFKPLADQIHAMGLKFGFHMMRGIPRQAVYAATPIEGSTFTAGDAGDPSNKCGWCPDMYGVKSNAAGQAWYDSMFKLYAAWGLDYIKVDDLSVPYRRGEIEMIRKAIDHCGRPIVFSTSPGPTVVRNGEHVEANANLWRISGDFWDHWKKLDAQFDLLWAWRDTAGPGHWPDADMIPFGRIAIRSKRGGDDHHSNFTKDEQITLLSLWAMAPSPLMLGGNLPDNDAWDLSLLTNDELLAIDQDALGKPAIRVSQSGGGEVWVKDLSDGSKAVALFNRGSVASDVTLAWADAKLTGWQKLRDIWQQKDIGQFDGEFKVSVPAHGAILLRVTPVVDPIQAYGPLAMQDDTTGIAMARAMVWGSIGNGPDPYFVAFRKQFTMPQAAQAAAFHIFADVRYLLWINGQYAGRGPARFDPKGPEYDTFDVSKFLKPGANTIAVVVMANASNGKMMRHAPGLTAELDVTGAGREHRLIETDETWHWSDQTRYRKPVVTWGNLQDRLDATVEDGDWTRPDYDDKAWKSAVHVDGNQWGMLSARRTPLLRETPVELTLSRSLPLTLATGDEVTLSAPRTVQAYSEVELDADAGTVINLAYAGVMYTARAGRQTFITSDTFAFQNGMIRVQKGRATLLSVRAIERLYPFDCVGSFHSSDPMLDRLWGVCVRGCQLISEDAYVDCADRERVEWMDEDPPAFDVTRVALAGPGQDGAKIFADARLLGAMLRRTALSQQPEGWVKAHTSSDRFDIHAKMEDRACDWVEGARRYYESTGDKEQIREIWPAILKQMNWFLDRRTGRGLVNAREWVVWGNPVGYQTFEGAGLNAFVYRALADAAYLGDAIDETKDATALNAAAKELASSFNAVLWDAKDATYYSGYWGEQAKSGERNQPLRLQKANGLVEPTMYPALFALDQGIVPADRIKETTTYLLHHRNEPKRMMAYYYLFKQMYAQHDAAMDQEVLDTIRTQWKAMSEWPGQSTWEEFSGSSKAHVYGMFPAYFLSAYVLGVRIDGPVWKKHLLIEPRLGDLTQAEGKVATEFGLVDVSWRRENERLSFVIVVPAGVTATIRLPGPGMLDGKPFDGVERALGPGRHDGNVKVTK